MKYVLVATTNVQRFMDAVKALEARLSDSEIMGMGLVYGRPGLGKTMAMNVYHSRSRKNGGSNVVKLRAMAHWTEASMMKDLLHALGQSPRRYRKDVMFDQMRETLESDPALFLIDEIDAIAESRRMIAMLKDLHDVTGSAILMIGEERVNGLLRRFDAFYNRMNAAALVRMRDHTEADVRAVIEQRCDVETAPQVCSEIHKTIGRSMRSVIDRIRDMEAFARTNGIPRIGPAEYRRLTGSGAAVPSIDGSERQAAAGGAYA